MHGALLEYSSPYRTVFTSYGMFSMPLRRWRRGRENGLVAIHAQRRNARPPPPRFSSTRGGQVIEDEERCAAASWLRFLRIQQMHSYQVPSAHTPTDRPRKTGPLAVVPASAAHCHGSQWNLDSGSLPCNISVPRRSVKSRGSLHLTTTGTTARLSPSGLKAESRNPSCHDDFRQPRPSSPPRTGRREARRPAAQDAEDPTAGETSLAVPQPIEASEMARFSILHCRSTLLHCLADSVDRRPWPVGRREGTGQLSAHEGGHWRAVWTGWVKQSMADEVNMRPKQRGRLHTESESANFSGQSRQTSSQVKPALSQTRPVIQPRSEESVPYQNDRVRLVRSSIVGLPELQSSEGSGKKEVWLLLLSNLQSSNALRAAVRKASIGDLLHLAIDCRVVVYPNLSSAWPHLDLLRTGACSAEALECKSWVSRQKGQWGLCGGGQAGSPRFRGTAHHQTGRNRSFRLRTAPSLHAAPRDHITVIVHLMEGDSRDFAQGVWLAAEERCCQGYQQGP
ncbi:hypothetical protein F5882DRAFT_435177 [Hyaloscypha sp. PMI_1271]|nr:hypothetical protein F5882DRAFT_435177 [Hyaloscypha sp. PMI_1271]